MKHRPPVTDGQRLFFFGLAALGIALVAVLMGYVIDKPPESPCVQVKYDVGARPQCVVVGGP